MMFERCYTSREQPGAEHGLGYSVVMDMVVMLNRTNTQGFFNKLLHQCAPGEEPEAAGHSACGTVRANRKDLPAAIVPGRNRRQLPRHEFQVT